MTRSRTLRLAVRALLLATGALYAQDAGFRLKSAEVVPGLYMLDSADDQFVGGNMGLMIGAIIYHRRAGDEPKEIAPAGVILVLALLYVIALFTN